jgi:uncharacterized protein (TIRG00374 family)
MTVPNPVEADVPVVSPKRPGRLLVRVAIALVILAAMAYAGRRYFGELDRLRTASPWLVVLMAGLYVAARLPPAALLRRALRALGHHIGRAEAFFVLMVQYYVNMLIPRAGIGALAGYFKIRRGVPVADLGAAQLVLLTLAQFACLGVTALACQAVLAASHVAPIDPVLAAVFAGVALVSLVPLFVHLPESVVGQSEDLLGRFIGKFFARLATASRMLGRDRSLLLRAFAAHLIVLVVRAARVQLSFYAVGQRVSFAVAFVVSAAADVMFLVSVTPGALGFREGGIVYASVRVTGMNPDVALAAAVLDRLVVTGCNLVIGQVGMWRYLGGTGRVVAGAAASPAVGADAEAGDAPAPAAADAGSSR